MKPHPIDVLLASSSKRIAKKTADLEVMRIYQAFDSMSSPNPSAKNLQMLGDMCNVLTALREMGIVEDERMLITSSKNCLLKIYRYNQRERKKIDQNKLLSARICMRLKKYFIGRVKFKNDELTTLRDIIENYDALLKTLPERVWVKARLKADKRVSKILKGHLKKDDIVV